MNIWTQLIAAKARRFETTAKTFSQSAPTCCPEPFKERMISYLLQGLKDEAINLTDIEEIIGEVLVRYIMES
jgi:hypothetical protein